MSVVSVNIVAVEKAINFTYSKCVSVTLVIKHAKRLRSIVICPALKYFSALSHKRQDFWKKKGYRI
jgi:hypothetical protein